MATKTKPKPEKPKRLKQTMIPGTEPPTVPEIEETAEELFDIREEKKRLKERDDETADKLIDLMIENHLTFYEQGRLRIDLQSKRKVRCKRKKVVVSDE